ncbi:MAG: hypothetical protein WDZ48_10925, partial [Pirellulales bacterium]
MGLFSFLARISHPDAYFLHWRITVIVVMKKEATPDDVEHMVQRIESLGLKAHVIVGTERTVIAAVGDDRKTHKESLESGPGVAAVMPILAPYKVASLEVKREPT